MGDVQEMKIKPGDYIKVIDWDNCTEDVYEYLGKSDDWYYSRGWKRKLRAIGENTITMFHESYMKEVDIKILDYIPEDISDKRGRTNKAKIRKI